MNNKPRYLLGFMAASLLMFFYPSLAEANGDIGLVFCFGLYFILGNILIALIEGTLIARLFSLKVRRTIFIMLGANYFSASVGVLLLLLLPSAVTGDKLPFPIITSHPIGVRIIFSYLLTVILEWPFCWWALSNKEKRAERSFLASLFAQTVSYAVFVFYYLLAFGTGYFKSRQGI